MHGQMCFNLSSTDHLAAYVADDRFWYVDILKRARLLTILVFEKKIFNESRIFSLYNGGIGGTAKSLDSQRIK
jgi:hypothetical protein